MATIMSAVGPYGQTTDGSAAPSPDDLLAQLNTLPTSPSQDVGLTVPGSVGPAGVTVAQAQQQAQQQAAQNAQRQAMLKGVDTSGPGADWRLRTAVNLAPDDASRLATIQAYAPDAQPLPGTDNFVYTDPATGRRTLYRTGLGPKDVTSLLAPAISTGVGAVGGGIGLLSGPVGGALGWGVGSAAGQEAATGLGEAAFGTKDVRTPAQMAADIGEEALAGAVVPELVKPFGKAAISLLSPYAVTPVMKAATDLHDAGIVPDLPDKLSLGLATGSPGVQRTEAAMAQTAGGAGVIKPLYRGTAQGVQTGVSNVADKAAGAGVPNVTTAEDPEGFASVVQGIANRMGDRWEVNRNLLDDDVTDAVGADTPTDIGPLAALHAQLSAAQGRSSRLLAGRYTPALTTLNDALADAADTSNGPAGTIPFSALQQARTDVGKMVDWKGPGAILPTGTAGMNHVYGAMNQAIENQVNASGPDAINAYNSYMNIVRDWNDENGGTGPAIKALQNPALGPQTLLNWAKSRVPLQQNMLANFMSIANPDERASLMGGIINQLGADPQTGTFVPSRFVKDWGSVSDNAKNMLFTGPYAGDTTHLDNLSTVANSQKQMVGETAGHSNTAAVLQVMDTLKDAGQSLMQGEPWAAAAHVAGGLGLPYATAKVMQSRPFVNWLSGTLADTSGDAWGRSIGRLATVGEVDPQMRDFTSLLAARMAQVQPPGGTSQ